jgi:hypothetical protein
MVTYLTSQVDSLKQDLQLKSERIMNASSSAEQHAEAHNMLVSTLRRKIVALALK